MANDKVVTNITIKRELLDRLTYEAEQRVIGRNLLINMALERFLDGLIPIEEATRKKDKNEEDHRNAVDQPGSGIRGDWLPAGPYSPSSAADPTDHSTGVC